MVFLDEAGFQLLPSVQRTWAPVGATPYLAHRTNRDKLSVISALSLSPTRRRVGLYYRVFAKNVQQAEICGFLRHLLRHLRGTVVVLWDNGGPHKGEPIRRLCARVRRLHLYAFPPYAPELNPDEGVWQASKHALANGAPDDLDQLLTILTEQLEDLRHRPRRLRACLHHAALPNILPRAPSR